MSAIALPQPPAFEVASVKASEIPPESGPVVARIRISPNSMTMRYVSVRDCLSWAFDLKYPQITGASLPDAHYDISAKSSSPATKAQLRAMLQTLLAERFRLISHRDSKIMSVFALLAGKNPKLEPAQGEGEMVVRRQVPELIYDHTTMADLAGVLTEAFEMPVIDMTEIAGAFHFKTNAEPYLRDEPPKVEGLTLDGAIFFLAVQDQLGLKLERRRATVEVLVVDRIEKPTDN
jgi:uncharacterized protein (TIGR03435 family)